MCRCIFMNTDVWNPRRKMSLTHFYVCTLLSRTYALRRVRDAFHDGRSASDPAVISGLIQNAEQQLEVVKRQVSNRGINSLATRGCGSNFNSLAPGRSFINVIFNLALLIGIFKSSNDNVLRWMPQDLTEKSTLVQLMAWCHQATSHYLSQYWPRSL